MTNGSSSSGPEASPGSVRDALEQVRRLLTGGAASGGRALQIYGAVGALGPALAAELAGFHSQEPASGTERESVRRHVLYVTADDDTAESRVHDLTFFLGGGAASEDPLLPPSVLHLPAPESSPYAEMQPDRRVLLRRMATLCRLAYEPRDLAPAVLVASADALFRRVMPRAPFCRRCHTLKSGQTLTRDEIVGLLAEAGFSRVAVVEDPGTFAVRGAVIDLFPPVYRHPVRLELFGDDIESLRLYDEGTQRTLRPLDEVLIHAVRETIRTDGADPRARLLEAADTATFPSSKTRQLLEQVEGGELFFGIEALAPIFHAEMVPFFSYLPADTVLVIEEPDEVVAAARRQETRLRETAAARIAEHRLALPAHAFVLGEADAAHELASARRLELRAIEVTGGPDRDDDVPHIRLRAEAHTTLRTELQRARAEDRSERPDGETDLGKPLRDRLRQWMGDGHRVRLVAPSRTHADRLAGLLKAWGLSPEEESKRTRDRSSMELAALLAPGGAPLRVLVGPLTRGFLLPADRLVLVAEEEIFGPRSHREPRASKAPSLGDLGEIHEGDPLVHDEHGVGRYRGLKKIAVRGVFQDFVHLEYDGGSVYVPVYRVGLLHRFSGVAPTDLRLDKLGGKTWQEKKRRVSAEARKVAEELLQLYAQRAALSGHAFKAPDAIFREFEETFPFDETPDQQKAIDSVLDDMVRGVPMDRLVCGDVGYGKTEVALRATLLAVLGGKQVAVLAPTTVLAEQHFVSFSERFADFPVRTAGLSRFRTKAEQSKTIAEIAAGKIDVVIGTHRLLSKDVRFKDLGLVVVDEEQRFGVVHKERLKELRTQVDVLTLTATPIPRTLQMAMGGLREISIIATPPADRLAIRTFVCRWDEELLGEAIRKELARGGQIFFVHNRVEDLEEWAEKVRKLSPPETRVAVAHGQMPEGELEKVMVDFVDARADILVCTTIIESGLDIPRANTMIVNRADRFGLAQLYQMRGRIGRSRERAFCYLVVPNEGGMTPEAKQRLAVLQRFTELGAGFQIATHDLEIRGAGELLGEKQSGAVAAVGFDTYARILEEAVAELKGQPIKTEADPEITVDVPAFLPDDYVPDTGQRLDFYRRLAQAVDEDEVRATLAELADRYGPLPEEAELLGEVMTQKTLVRSLGALAYEVGAARLQLTLGADTRLDPAKVMKLVQQKKSRWKLTPDMRLSFTFDDDDKQDRLRAGRRCLADIRACLS